MIRNYKCILLELDSSWPWGVMNVWSGCNLCNHSHRNVKFYCTALAPDHTMCLNCCVQLSSCCTSLLACFLPAEHICLSPRPNISNSKAFDLYVSLNTLFFCFIMFQTLFTLFRARWMDGWMIWLIDLLFIKSQVQWGDLSDNCLYTNNSLAWPFRVETWPIWGEVCLEEHSASAPPSVWGARSWKL